MKKINSLNSQASVKFDRMDDRDRPFKKLSDLIAENGNEDTTYKVDGCYINTKGKFGDNGVIVSGDINIDIPQGGVESIRKILENEELINLINAGKMYVRPYSYNSKKYNKLCYNVEYLTED